MLWVTGSCIGVAVSSPLKQYVPILVVAEASGVPDSCHGAASGRATVLPTAKRPRIRSADPRGRGRDQRTLAGSYIRTENLEE